MNFNYTTWSNGDVLTADKMNFISGKVIIIEPTANDEEGRNELGYSFADIVNMLRNGFLPVVTSDNYLLYVERVYSDGSSFSVDFSSPSGGRIESYSSETNTGELYSYMSS